MLPLRQFHFVAVAEGDVKFRVVVFTGTIMLMIGLRLAFEFLCSIWYVFGVSYYFVCVTDLTEKSNEGIHHNIHRVARWRHPRAMGGYDRSRHQHLIPPDPATEPPRDDRPHHIMIRRECRRRPHRLLRGIRGRSSSCTAGLRIRS